MQTRKYDYILHKLILYPTKQNNNIFPTDWSIFQSTTDDETDFITCGPNYFCLSLVLSVNRNDHNVQKPIA